MRRELRILLITSLLGELGLGRRILVAGSKMEIFKIDEGILISMGCVSPLGNCAPKLWILPQRPQYGVTRPWVEDLGRFP
ncbi:MAG: hypothetical protein CM1200mP14_20220 [Gammaproteobacteria bacterium]|nr:MAG: hypothetical protein CM1200mP14_20220 [Gammaproteobacteria bacterium]